MTGIILTLGSAGIMCITGVGLSTALKWFHSYELDTSRKPKRELDEKVDDPNAERIRAMKRRVNQS